MQTINLGVLGMHCASCAMRVQLEVEELPGIGEIDIDPHGDRVTVEFDPNQTSVEAISAAIATAGYTVVS